MRRTVTAILLVASTGVSIWMYVTPSAPLHVMMNDNSGSGIVKQLTLAAAMACFSFGAGRFFSNGRLA